MAHKSRLLVCLPICISIATVNMDRAKADDVLWTQHPVRIDRSKQHFQRLPALQHESDSRTWIMVPERIKMLDSASFSFGGNTYRIGNLRPVTLRRVCKDVVAGRWVCGRMAAIFLSNLVRGKRLLCDVSAGKEETILNHCQSGTRDIASAIVASGFARADAKGALESTEQLARTKKSGLWRNPDCLVDFDRC